MTFPLEILLVRFWVKQLLNIDSVQWQMMGALMENLHLCIGVNGATVEALNQTSRTDERLNQNVFKIVLWKSI